MFRIEKKKELHGGRSVDIERCEEIAQFCVLSKPRDQNV